MDEQELKHMAAQLRKPEGEAGIKTGEWMNVGNLQINRDALKVLNAQNSDDILEVGMGNGFFVTEILKNNPSVNYTGCDFSDIMVQEAERINGEWISKGQAKFMNANITSLPFQNESFDKILTINTIYFWEDEHIVLNELKRVLKPEAELILTLRPKHQMIHYPFTQYGFKMYSKSELTDLLHTNGLKIKAVFENKEPEFELHGEIMKMENLIVVATKK